MTVYSIVYKKRPCLQTVHLCIFYKHNKMSAVSTFAFFRGPVIDFTCTVYSLEYFPITPDKMSNSSNIILIFKEQLKQKATFSDSEGLGAPVANSHSVEHSLVCTAQSSNLFLWCSSEFTYVTRRDNTASAWVIYQATVILLAWLALCMLQEDTCRGLGKHIHRLCITVSHA